MPRTTRESYVATPHHGGAASVSSRVLRRRMILAVSTAVLAAIVLAVLVAGVLIASASSGNGLPPLVGGSASAAGREDGYINDFDPVSPFDTEHPGVSGIDPVLLEAVQTAAKDAEAEGFELLLTSGWRSVKYQEELLRDAINEYGSEEAASEFVSSPETSQHVTGNAVDIWGVDPAIWLGENGNAYGLCQIYSNERWHFELATEPGGECPAQLANASESA